MVDDVEVEPLGGCALHIAGFLAGLLIMILEADDDPIMYTGGAAYDLVNVVLMAVIEL